MSVGSSVRHRRVYQPKGPDQPFYKLTENFQFEDKVLLKKGGYGKVYYIKRNTTNEKYALKEVLKSGLLRKDQKKSIRRERLALKKLDSPFIIKLHATYQNLSAVYFLLDFMELGDLHDHLNIYKGPLELACIRFFAAEIVKALEHLRENNFVHRDIKKKNILIDMNFHLKLSDFGAARRIGESQGSLLSDSVRNSLAGTKSFIAPEVWYKEDVTFGTDYWNLGFVVNNMYTRESISWNVTSEKDHEFFQKIETFSWKYPCPNPDREINDLVYRLMRRDPEQRIGTSNFQDLRDHPFFKGINWHNLAYTISPRIRVTHCRDGGRCVASSVPLLDLQMLKTTNRQQSPPTSTLDAHTPYREVQTSTTSSEGAKETLRGAEGVQRGCQSSLRGATKYPIGAQMAIIGTRLSPRGQIPPRESRWSPRTSERSPRSAQISPKGAHWSPRTSQDSPEGDQESPREEFWSSRTSERPSSVAYISPQKAFLSPRKLQESPRGAEAPPKHKTSPSGESQAQTSMQSWDAMWQFLGSPTSTASTPYSQTSLPKSLSREINYEEETVPKNHSPAHNDDEDSDSLHTGEYGEW